MQRPAARAMGPFRRSTSGLRRLFGLGHRGAVALVTAVCAPVLLMIVGFGADYGYASYINQCLARAADAATLGSVSQTAATAVGGYSKLSELQTYGTNYFNANIAALSLTGVTFNLQVVSDGSGGVIATSTYSYNAPTTFSNFIGVKTRPLNGGARTTARPLTYVNYYILVDTSQSMGIASTQADMDKLYNLIVANKNGSNNQVGCVFACHVRAPKANNQNDLQPYINEVLAHNNGIELRIDAAVTAVKSIITQAQTIASVNKNINFAIFSLQADPTTNKNLRVVASTSNDYTSLQNAASTIDLGNNVAGGTGDTDIPNELAAFNQWLSSNGVTTNGSGASATAPLNYFLFVTDGVTDVKGSCTSGHCTGPVNPSDCGLLKGKGTVGVVYTTYNDIWQNNDPSSGVLQDDYNNLIVKNGVKPKIRPNLISCASSTDFFFEASDGPDIVAAMQALFARTQPSSARITQ